jgi:hypothetical protein
MAAQIVRNDEDVPFGIVRFNGLEQLDVILRIARGGAERNLLAITNAQSSIDPDPFLAATVF